MKRNGARTTRSRPSGEKFLAFSDEVLPKIGPLRVLEFRRPTPETEKMFEASFNATLDRYRKLLAKQVEKGAHRIANDNFDTGEILRPGKYRLNDEAHAKLLDLLSEAEILRRLRRRCGRNCWISTADPNAPYATKSKPKEWAQVQIELAPVESCAAAAPVRGRQSSSASTTDLPLCRAALRDANVAGIN